MYFTAKKPTAQPCEGSIRFWDRDLGFKASVLPARQAPHVGADSPRFMEGPRPSTVDWYMLFDDEGQDITNRYWLYRDDIRARILEQYRYQRTADALMRRIG